MLPLHPAVVHAPLGLALAVPLVLLALTYALFRGKIGARMFLFASLLQGLIVGGGLLALATGNIEESRVERVVAEAAIERHEDLATAFVIAASAVLLATLVTAFGRGRWPRRLAVVTTAASFGVLALGLAVGHAGGELVYRDGAASAYAPARGGAVVPGPERATADEDD